MPAFIRQNGILSAVIFPIVQMFVGGWVHTIERSGLVEYLLAFSLGSYRILRFFFPQLINSSFLFCATPVIPPLALHSLPLLVWGSNPAHLLH